MGGVSFEVARNLKVLSSRSGLSAALPRELGLDSIFHTCPLSTIIPRHPRVIAFPGAPTAQRPTILNNFAMEVDSLAALSARDALSLVSGKVLGANVHVYIGELK